MSCSADHLVVYDGTPNLYDELQLVIAGLQMSLQCKDEHIAELEARLEQQQPQQCGVTDDAASTGVPPTYDTISVPSTPTELCGTPSSDHALQVVCTPLHTQCIILGRAQQRPWTQDSQDALHAALQQNEVLRSRLAILSKEMEAMQHVHRHRIAAMQVCAHHHQVNEMLRLLLLLLQHALSTHTSTHI